MISADDAKRLVLRSCEQNTGERFAIQGCEISERNDYWIVWANSEEYVVRGRTDRCYIGVSAYLVNADTGDIEIVGNSRTWEQCLQDKYDVEDAKGLVYVLEPSFDISDKAAMVHLRQQLGRSYQEIQRLLSPAHRRWLTGPRRILGDAQTLFDKQGIRTTIVLREDAGTAARIDGREWYWDALASRIRA